MTHPYRSRLPEGEELGWQLRVFVLSLALFLGFFDHALHGWGRPGFAAGIALFSPIVGYHKFWDQSRFWITVVLLVAIQVPLTIMFRPLIEQFKLIGMLVFAIGDCFVITLAIAWVCAQCRDNDPSCKHEND